MTKKTVAIVGYGDIGKSTAQRCQAFGLETIIYDPGVDSVDEKSILKKWPDNIAKCNFIIFTCSLNDSNKHMLNSTTLDMTMNGVRIINVARGPLINETDLVDALEKGKVHSAALDVYEQEPLPYSSSLRDQPFCILGSHNSSNTIVLIPSWRAQDIDNLEDWNRAEKIYKSLHNIRRTRL